MDENPYRSPMAPGRQPDRSNKLAASALGLTAALLLAVLGTQGYFRRVFDEFGLDLPGITAVSCSPIFVWLAGALFGVTIVMQSIPAGRTTKTACNAVAIAAALLLGALYFVAMCVPFLQLIGNLSGRNDRVPSGQCHQADQREAGFCGKDDDRPPHCFPEMGGLGTEGAESTEEAAEVRSRIQQKSERLVNQTRVFPLQRARPDIRSVVATRRKWDLRTLARGLKALESHGYRHSVLRRVAFRLLRLPFADASPADL